MLIVQQRAALESETITWRNNVYGNSGTLTEMALRAHDNLVKDIKNYNLRSLVQYLITYSGDQLAAALCPVIYDVGSSVATNHNFVAGDLTSTGLSTNDVSTKYLEFGFNADAFGSANNYHFAYLRTNTRSTDYDYAAFGARNSDGTDAVIAYERATGNVELALRGNGSTRTVMLTGANLLNPGFCIGSRVSSTSLTGEFKPNNQTLISATQTNSISLVGIAYANVGFARSAAGTLGYQYGNNRLGIVSFGYGMDATQRANFRTCINNFLSRMGRTTFQ